MLVFCVYTASSQDANRTEVAGAKTEREQFNDKYKYIVSFLNRQRVFTDSSMVVTRLDKASKKKVEEYDIQTYIPRSMHQISFMLEKQFEDGVFFQYLNTPDTSYISINSFDTKRYQFGSLLPYHHKSFPYGTIVKIYYADGTAENCNYYLGEIPRGKLMTKLDVKVNYPVYSEVIKISLSKQTPEYTDGDQFVRLLSLDAKEAKLWLSGDVNRNALVVVTTESGRTMSMSSYPKTVKAFPAATAKYLDSVQTQLKQVYNDVDADKISKENELLDNMKDAISDKLDKLDKESALLISLDNELIKNLDIVLRKGEDTISETISMVNADIMTPKIGFRLVGKSIVNNAGDVVAQFPYFKMERALGLFFDIRKTEADKWSYFRFNADTKEMIETPYDTPNGLGRDSRYDYDFIETRDKETGKYGVTDLAGNIVVPNSYDRIKYDPYDKLFMLQESGDDPENDTAKVVDMKGNIILENKYILIEMGRYFITAYEREEVKVFNKKGKSLLKKEWSIWPAINVKDLEELQIDSDDDDFGLGGNKSFDEPLMKVWNKSSPDPFFINNQGKVVLKEDGRYSFVGDFSEGVASVKTKKGKPKYGFINLGGHLVVPMVYDSVFPFKNGYAKVQKNGKTYYINKENQTFDKRPWIENPREAPVLISIP